MLFFLKTEISFANEDSPYLEVLLERSLELKLHEDPYWHTILHYQKGFFGGSESLIDDPLFFNSSTGKKNPKEELEATLKSFFNPVGKNSNEHSQCRFILRYNWLSEKLSIDRKLLPLSPCTDFKRAIESLNPKSIAIVFPTSYMNSPASMFGHTLLRIDSTDNSPLLSHSINYAANTDETSGFAFALRGLLGYYHGRYSHAPYYEKVNKYSGIKFRDIWEYKLNLDEIEVERLLMHLWELLPVYSDYFFFDENCSYNLMYLLEAARPGSKLTQNIKAFSFWVIPIDTLKKLQKEDFIKDSTYRPSKAVKIKTNASKLTKEETKISLDLALGKNTPLDESLTKFTKEQKIKILDTAAEYNQTLPSKKKLPEAENRKIFLSLLTARKDLGKSETKPNNDFVEKKNPLDGHSSSRITLTYGAVKTKLKREEYSELAYSSAYHDILDPLRGYDEGSQINFIGFKVRHYPSLNETRLHQFTITDILSLSPRDAFFKPMSWKLSSKIVDKVLIDGKNHHVFSNTIGFGLTTKGSCFDIIAITADVEVNLSYRYEDNHSAGAGGSFYLIKNFSDRFRLIGTARYIDRTLGDDDDIKEITAGAMLKISKNNSLKFRLKRQKSFDIYSNDAKIEWNLYF